MKKNNIKKIMFDKTKNSTSIRVRKVILIIVFIFIGLILFSIIKDRLQFINESYLKGEITKNIIFEPYSNENNLIVLVTVEDLENGINKITYRDKDGSEKIINAHGKNKVSIDYEIENDGEYIFTVYNDVGEKIEKTLVIDSINKENDTLGNLIDIVIDPVIDDGRSVATKANVTLTYNYGFGNNYYKVGNSGSWSQYNDTFQIDSYTILKNSLQENDGNSVTIYAKKEDTVGNKIIISKQTTQIDLDIPDSPGISINAEPYPILTTEGVKLSSNINIKFEDRNDITNFYSIDKGNTWIEYTESISIDGFDIYAKSVKNESGLEIISKENVNPSASDAIGTLAYDNNRSTYYYIIRGKRCYMHISDEMIGKNVKMYLQKDGTEAISIEFYDANSECISSLQLLSYSITGTKVWDSSVTIPENAVSFSLRIATWNTAGMFIYEIGL